MAGERTEHELAGLVLTLRQPELVADAPPGESERATGGDEPVAPEVRGEKRTRLAAGDGAVKVENGYAYQV